MGNERPAVEYAIIQAAGHQHRVEPGQVLVLDRINRKPGEPVRFDRVLFVHRRDGSMVTGTPTVQGAIVTGLVAEQTRGTKVRVFRRKRRKGKRVTRGHRMNITRVQINEISEVGIPAEIAGIGSAKTGPVVDLGPVAIPAVEGPAVQPDKRVGVASDTQTEVNVLTPQEVVLLQQAGVDVDGHSGRDPIDEYLNVFDQMLATGLSPSDAARRILGVEQATVEHVAQMIRKGTLYAVQVGDQWRIPEFQFDGDGLVPNIDSVNAVVPRTLDAVSVLLWYTTPDPELETQDGRELSPLAWLKSRMDPAAIIEIARDL